MKREKPKAGVPQLWLRRSQDDSLRIIYPDGKVEYFFEVSWYGEGWKWKNGCTSRATQLEAIKECKRYSWEFLHSTSEFVCNIE